MRVERFIDVRAADLLVVKDCRACGKRECRGIAVHRYRDVGLTVWVCEPRCDNDPRYDNSGIDKYSVSEGRVYRVVIPGLEASDSSTSHRHTRKPAGERIR